MNVEKEERVQLEILREDTELVRIFLSTILCCLVYCSPQESQCADFIFQINVSWILQPAFLERKPLASINLWMNNAEARSSTHYDPHHNLLCVVAGRKQGEVILLVFSSMDAPLCS